jgi:hypothetical protein
VFRSLVGVAIVLGLVVVGATSAWAQAVAGSQLSGVVRDSSNAPIPGAEITVTKTDTGMTRTTFTSLDGAYAFPNLPVGPYQLKVGLQGFNTYVRDGIVLQVGSNPELNVTLAVGNISEQITVTANTSLVETKNTGVGQVIDNQRVMELPLNGRQATELIFLSGLATSAPAGDLNTNKNFPTVTISVAGGQANGITYIMDGGTHNDPFNNLNLPTPFPDALQEFKVETSALPARYGHHAASAVNLVTKSGSNQLSWRRIRLQSQLAIQRAQLLRSDARQLEPQSVRWNGRRAGRQEQGVLFRRLSGTGRTEQSEHRVEFCADAGDAERRLHANHFAGLQRRPPDHPHRTVCRHRQSSRPVALEQRLAEFPQARAGFERSLRTAPVRYPEQQHRTSGPGQDRLHDQPEPDAVRALFLRDLRQPGDLRRQERLDVEPHRSEQPGAFDRGRAQLGVVAQHLELVSRHVQQDLERSAAAGVLHADRAGKQHFQPATRLHGHERHRQRLQRWRGRDESWLFQFGRLAAR